jgi:predicted nucleotidyltransferase
MVILGDVDRDSDIDIIDATLIQKIALNIKWH